VLDEVDAALDEANIGRFSSALRGLADRIQFIVITHNRGTIEAADALYGVTIGEDAVSRIVSLRLPSENGAETPAEEMAERGRDRWLTSAIPGLCRVTSRASRGRAARSPVGCAACSVAHSTTKRGRRSRRRSSRPTWGRSWRCASSRERVRGATRPTPKPPSWASWPALFAERDPTPWPRKPAVDVPAVLLIVGVNGTGKTTTIAKLAYRFSTRGAKVLLAAADTFRAAAIEQLQAWAGRIGVPVVAHASGADPSAVVYDALDAAVARRTDVVIIDTAGRLHTKSNLMDELAKVRRTIAKRVPDATPEILFVLDATTGQNGLSQAKAFHEAVGLNGIVLTKLDSTARGGIAFAIEDALKVPVLFVGVGERPEDLLDFDPRAFVEALLR
jgi:signal recognition particle-docking protein FtsY